MTDLAMSPETPLPVLLTISERATLARVLDYVETFDYAGLSSEARRLRSLLGDPSRIGDAVTYSYAVVGPWGSANAGDEESAVAEVRKARAEHWASGLGRDDRYRQIQARRTAHVSFSSDESMSGSYWQQDEGDSIEVLDAPLTAVEEVENTRRIKDASQRREVLYTHLRARAEAKHHPARQPCPES